MLTISCVEAQMGLALLFLAEGEGGGGIGLKSNPTHRGWGNILHAKFAQIRNLIKLKFSLNLIKNQT